MMMSGNKIVLVCPECEASIRIKKPPVINQSITCGYCHTKLAVTQVNPIELWPVNQEALFYEQGSRRQNGGKKHERRRRDYDDWG